MSSRDVMIRLKADASGMIAGIDKGAKRLTAFDAELQKTASRRQAINDVGNAFGAVGLAATAGLGASVKAAMDWETSWAGVTKTVEGSAQEMAVIEQQLRDMATSMPATHAEIAAVAQAAGALGVATPDVADFTKTMIMLGEATDDLTADQAATSMAQFMNVMQTAPGDVDNLANALVRLGNNGASTEGQILQLAQNLAGAGATVGLAESEVFGIANALASVGIEAEAGGSAVSKILIDMSKAAATGSPKLRTWASVADMSVKQFKDMVQNSPAEAFDVFTKGLGEINAAGGDVFTILSELGQSDIRVTRALLGMANAGDLLSDSLEMGADAFANGTDAQDEYAKRSETAAAQLQVAWNGIKDNLIDIGASALPVVKDFTNVVKDLTGAFSDLPEGVQGSVAKFLGLTAALGGGTFVVSRMVTGYADLANVLSDAAGQGERISRGRLFARGGAGVAGLGLLSIAGAAGEADASLGLLASTLGGAATGFAVGGPWGAAIGTAVGMVGGLAGAHASAAGDVDALTATLDAQTDAITANTVEWVNNKLRKDGAMDAGLRIGLDPATLTDAALGNRAAMDDVRAAIDAVSKTATVGGGDFSAESVLTAEQKAALTLQDELGNVNDAYKKAREQREQDNDSKRGSIELNRVTAEQAESLAKKVKGMPLSVATQFTTPGYENAEQNALDLAYKYDLTPKEVETILRSLDYATPQINAVLEAMRNADSKVARPRVDAVTAAAMAALTRVGNALGALRSREITVTTVERTVKQTITESFTRPGSADNGARSARELFERANGGVVDYYANGGMRESHVAQIAPAGAWRVWAEPETGGEAYIPLAESKRRRSLEIWAQTGRRLGVEGYANGGIRGGRLGASAPITASLVGARAKLVGPNLVEFVDGRIALGIAGQENYLAGRARARGRR